jgi:hypothetical protein
MLSNKIIPDLHERSSVSVGSRVFENIVEAGRKTRERDWMVDRTTSTVLRDFHSINPSPILPNLFTAPAPPSTVHPSSLVWSLNELWLLMQWPPPGYARRICRVPIPYISLYWPQPGLSLKQ